jgi:DNA-binding NarL/FixJ family response regulator
VAIRLVLADDHPVVLHGLERLFERHGDFQVLECCLDGDAALAAVRGLQPDVLLLDLRMPGRGGLDVLRAMVEERSRCRVVVLTAALTDADTVELLRLGVMGIVRKEASSSALLECVRRVHTGRKSIDGEIYAGAFERVMRRESAAMDVASKLTPREIEIVRIVAQGCRNREIADRLKIAEATVKIHLHNIFERLGVASRVELVLYAKDKGLG